MNFGSKSFYALIFLLIFLIILIIGVTSEVSWSASFTRAIMAAGLFTVLTWVVGKVISACVFPPDQVGDLIPQNENLGANIDLTITESPDGIGQSENIPANVPPAGTEEFVPISARQIDPQLSKIINSDPHKMAEIVRKMGFEEEQ